MRIKSIEITNWGPHKHRVFNTDASIVGIIGTNGKGKSNLLQAIDYALTGNLNKQKQEKYIRNFGQEDGATSASVHLVFEKDGKEGDIVRTITATGARRKLKWDNSEWTKAADVDRIMEEIIGADKASLAQAVFIKQGELARIIKGTPAERQTLFQKLMNLSFIEPRVDDITAKIAAIRGSLTDMRPALTLAENDLKACELDMMELLPNVGKSRTLETVISKLDLLKFWLRTIDERASIIPDAQKRLQQAQAALALKFTELKITGVDALLEKEKTTKQALAIAKNSLDSCRAYKQQLAERNRIVSIIEFNKKELKEKFFYVTHPDYFFDAINTLTEQINAAQARYDQALALYNATTAIELATHRYTTEFELWKEAIDTASEEIPELEEQLKTISESAAKLTVDIAYAEARAAIFDVGVDNSTICPLCGADSTKQAISLPGETREDTQRRLEREVRELKALKLSETQTMDSIAARVVACQQTLLLPDPTDEYKKAIAIHNEVIAAADKDLIGVDPASIQTKLNTMNRQLQDISNVRAQYVTIEDIIASHEAKLAKLPVVEAPANTEEETALINKVNTLTAEAAHIKGDIAIIQQLNQAIQKAESFVATLQNQHEDAVRGYEQDLAEAENIPDFVLYWLTVDPEEKLRRNSIADITTVTTQLCEDKTEADKAAAKYEQLSERKEELQQRIEALQLEVANNEVKQTLIDDLNTAKSMIMRTGVPLAFMNEVFNKLVGIVQETLTRMGSNFNVIPDPERACSFLFVRTDNSSKFEMQQEQLSGGQAIRLALALLLACQQLILPDIGLLVLDEPSSHIDSEGVEQMRDLFISLRGVLQNTHMQLIIVDHNEKLTTSFETTIVL